VCCLCGGGGVRFSMLCNIAPSNMMWQCSCLLFKNILAIIPVRCNGRKYCSSRYYPSDHHTTPATLRYFSITHMYPNLSRHRPRLPKHIIVYHNLPIICPTSPFPVVSSFGCTRAILISLIVVHAAEHHRHPLRPSPPPRSHHHDRITSTSPFIVRLDHTTIPPPRTTNVAIVPNVHVLPLLSMHASLTSLSRVDLTYFLDTPAFP
jgi:hypothetical protein